MIEFRHLLWAFVCLSILVAGCGPSPSGQEELPLATSEVIPGPDQPAATPTEAPQTPPVAPSASPTPSPTPTKAEPADTGGREMRLTPVGTLIVEPVPTLGGEAVIGEVPEDLLEAILADAAERTGLPPEAFTVVRAEAVVWSDGSLGCPQPDMLYTQAPVDGYWIVLEAGDKHLDYRAAESGFFSLCEGDVRVPFPSPGDAAAPTPEQ